MNVYLNAVTENECIKQLNSTYMLYLILCYCVYVFAVYGQTVLVLFNSTKFLNKFNTPNNDLFRGTILLHCCLLSFLGVFLKFKIKNITHTVCFKSIE